MSFSFYKLLYNIPSNAHKLWYKFVFTWDFFLNKGSGFASHKALVSQEMPVTGSVIKVMWLSWETVLGKALHKIFIFVYKVACFGQVNPIEYNSMDCNINLKHIHAHQLVV
ncbi:Hypothetical predicted protein [Podarcis lilfordi]|uniref:Uncharacterized protein n=1 Tax=Podarcis lilfordi TaxID=74358 RepID=A0AA35K8S3_9SAUR|nr:Hypothetical predicted protein [Podarcis lilfordi]